MDLQLEGKKALVTGGSRGIGQAIALQLALEGCDVAIAARSAGPLQEAAEAIAAQSGRKVVPVTTDVTDAESIKRCVAQAAEALGGLEILVNDAARPGGAAPDDFDSVTDELLLSDFQEKTMGYFRCAREAVPHMKTAGWGRIVNIGGVLTRYPTNFSTPARNAAMIVMSKALATSMAPFGITVNVVHPGIAVTERTMQRYRDMAARDNTTVEAVMAGHASQMTNKRLVMAEDIGRVVAFLASPVAFSISGEAISVAGGQGTAAHL